MKKSTLPAEKMPASGKLKIKILAGALTVLLLLAGTVGVVWAYFTLSAEKEPALSLDFTAETVQIPDFDALFAAVKAESYNDGAPVSQNGSVSRRTLLLTADISLPADLLVSADVSLDLGGHDLILNGYTLTFRHTYAGALTVRNGRVILSAGQTGGILADTPRAAVLFEGVTVGTLSESGDFTAATGSFLRVISTDPAFVAAHFFSKVAAALADESTLLRSLPEADSLTGKTGFTPDLFWVAPGYCTAHPDSPCSLLLSDADLPLHEYGYPGVTVAYTGDSVISGQGRRLSAGDGTLCAVVTVDGGEGETTFSCEFPLHAPDLSTLSARASAALTLAGRVLSRYRGTVSGEETVWTGLVLNRDTYLPRTFGALPDVRLSYTGADEAGMLTFPAAGSEPLRTDATELFVPTADTVTLTVTASGTDGTFLSDSSFEMRSTNTANVRSAVTVAGDLLKKWYGQKIEVTANGDGSYSYAGAQAADPTVGYCPLYTLEYYTQGGFAAECPGVSRIAYSVVYGNTAAQYYGLEAAAAGENWERLFVATGNPEDDAGRVYLHVEMRVTYGGVPSDVTLELPIECYQKGDEGGTSRFLPYYSVLDRTVYAQTGGRTHAAFEMPFNYQRGMPVMVYGFTVIGGDEAALSAVAGMMGLVFVDKDGVEHTLSGKLVSLTPAGESEAVTVLSFADSLAEILTTSALYRANAESGKAYYRVTIDAGEAPAANTEIALVYQYKMAYTAASFTTYRQYSAFTVPGLLRYGKEIPDENFFLWIYNRFRPSGEEIDSVGDAVIEADWLRNDLPLDRADTGDTRLLAVTDFTGIRYLRGTTRVNLTGATVTAAVIREIAYMESLTSLTLESCDITVSDTDDNPFESWCDPALSELSGLTLLRLGGNRISSFVWLLDFCRNVAGNLTKIYISDNVPGTGDADNVFYGSDGLSNYDTYQSLSEMGVEIYSGGSLVGPALFADSRSAAQVYLSLRSLSYQNKLPAGVSLTEEMLSQYSTDPADYGLSGEVSNAKYSCTADSVKIAFALADANTFTLTYTATVGTDTYRMVLHFTVTAD